MGTLCDEIKKLGKGVSNTFRYEILEALIKGPKTVGELVKIVRLSQPAVSQHLKVLKACDLVTDDKKGQEVFYAVNIEHTLSLLKEFVVTVSRCKKHKELTKPKKIIN